MIQRAFKRVVRAVTKSSYDTLNTIKISEENVLHNLQLLRRYSKGSGVIPVLKANAYGHGIAEVASILNKADCDFIAVDGYFEAHAIKKITKHKILVLGYINPSNIKLLDVTKCSFVVQDIEGLHAFGKLKRRVCIHVEINTGMNRLGLSEEELDEYLGVLRMYPKLHLEGVMSHLADADNPGDDTFTRDQVAVFDSAVERIRQAGFDPTYIHIAQTAGSPKVKSAYANGVRIGIGLYGLNPLNKEDAYFGDLEQLKPVLSLQSTIVKIITLKKGDRVSYNGIFRAPKKMKIGVLPLGYYEGVPRELSNKGAVTIKGASTPIVGRVCMNYTMISLDAIHCSVGDRVTVISSTPSDPNSVKQICNTHGLFNYTLVTKLSSSIRRLVV